MSIVSFTAPARRHLRPLLALAAAGLGCTGATELCACTYPPTAAVLVTGTVTRAGAPVRGTYVGEETYAGACPLVGAGGTPSTLNVMARSAPTDAAGRYALEIRVGARPADACVRLTASTPATPPGSPAVLATAERAGVRLRDSRLGGPPLDTLRVDFALP